MLRLLSPLALAALALSTPAQVLVPEALPLEVRAHASRLDQSGAFHVQLSCYPREALERDYDLRIAVDAWADEYSLQELSPKPPTSRWKRGSAVELDVDLRVPDDSQLGFGDQLTVLVTFIDKETGAVVPPEYPAADAEGYSEVEAFDLPGFLGTEGAAELEALFAEARGLDAPAAWARLEAGLRRAGDDDTKERFRDELLRVGKFAPAPLSELEQSVVANRISGEQVRYWRIIAGRMYDRGKLHGAMRLLERTGGALSEQADRAVIGALGDAERTQQRVDDIRQRLIEELSEEDAALAKELEAKHGQTRALLKEAESLAAKGSYPVALELVRRLRRSDDDKVEARAWELLDEYAEAWVALTPPEELAEVQAALDHPSWARTETVASHCFLFIGPRELVQNIPAASKLNFDLAYVFLTDLFGRVPNPEGDRVTVYFKELFDFGGGIGGGKIIDIGKADPAPKSPVRVDNGLLYHELTHCIDDTQPIFAGFREGLANMGAAYASEALDQDADALHSFDSNLEEFRKYFLDRDVAYWRIQNYGPSAGFFLYFEEEYASLSKARHDWSPLRQFFREYREAPVRDGREPYIVRGLAHYLVRAFGPAAFDDLVRFGFPLEERDRRAIGLELAAFDYEDFTIFEEATSDFPTSPVPRDRVGRDVARSGDYESEEAREARRKHGVISAWKTVGPFFTRNGDAGAVPFEPEWHIDFTSKVEALRSTKDETTRLLWRDPIGTWQSDAHLSPVTIDATGWLHFDYQPYGQRDAAIYAVTSVTLEEASEVAVHARADDDFSLFIDGVRLGAYRGRGANGSSDNARWRGPFQHLPDAQRFDLSMGAGRHTVLVKIKNGGGTAGLVLALSKPDGSTLEFTTDTDPVEERRAPRKVSWKRLARLDARSMKGKSKTTVGGFKTVNKALRGTKTDGGVQWRRFTVRPGFPKDSPSNLFWLKEKLTEDVLDLKLELELTREPRAPKLLLTIQGEGEDDGLSGWTLLLLPSGGSAVSARLERYDRLVYQTEPKPLPAGEGPLLVSLECLDDEVTVKLDELVLFDRVPIRPIPGKFGVGLATWGDSPAIELLEVSSAKR